MNIINANYERVISIPSDIWEHLPLMCKYAMECETVVEIGVRSIVSTWAFLKGLYHNSSDRKRLICVDVDDIPSMDAVIGFAQEAGIEVKFVRGDSATIDLRASSRPFPGKRHENDDYDMLFIDSWHVGGHLERELSNHAHKIRKYILMHDTEGDAISGESVRCGYNILEQSKQYGYTEAAIRSGLKSVIECFLKNHPEWILKEQFTYNNGITVLQRVIKPSL